MPRLRYPLYLLVIPVFAACKLVDDSGLKSEMPTKSDAPLNAVISFVYRGENFISQESIKSGGITVTECEKPKDETTEDKKDDASKEPKDPKSDKKKEDTPAPVVQIQGYSYAYGEKDGNDKVTHLFFIPSPTSEASSPLKPDTDYCVVTTDYKDKKGNKIPGVTQGLQFHSQRNADKQPFFEFQNTLEVNSDFPQDDENKPTKSFAYSTIPFLGTKNDGSLREIKETDFVAFYLNQPFNPRQILAGSFVCQEPLDKQEMDNPDCNGWSSVRINHAYLVETFKKDANGWIVAEFNKYSFFASYSAARNYRWVIGTKKNGHSGSVGIANNETFTVIGANDDSSQNKDDDRIPLLNKLFDEANVGDQKIKEGERAFYVPITES